MEWPLSRGRNPLSAQRSPALLPDAPSWMPTPLRTLGNNSQRYPFLGEPQSARSLPGAHRPHASGAGPPAKQPGACLTTPPRATRWRSVKRPPRPARFKMLDLSGNSLTEDMVLSCSRTCLHWSPCPWREHHQEAR